MNFFKKLFSTKNRKETQFQTNNEKINFQGISSKESFNERYSEDPIDPAMLDGCLKMVESYFIDNKIKREIQTPINDPLNLDQVVDNGIGFELYCKAFNLDKNQSAMFLAYSLSDFLINKYSFSLFKDIQPEYPLRTMTLKYDKNGIVLSLYPFEYAMKVLDYNASFQDLIIKIETNIGSMDEVKDEIDKL